jgi:hypothetical protein
MTNGKNQGFYERKKLKDVWYFLSSGALEEGSNLSKKQPSH